MQANMNCSNVVTTTMLPIVLMATNTHWTTCCGGRGQCTCEHAWGKPLLCIPHPLTAGMGPRKSGSLPRAMGWDRPLPQTGSGNWVPGPANPTGHNACHITSREDLHGPRTPSPSLPLTFRPFALFMARRGLNTLSTRRIFTTEMALDLRRKAELRWGDSPAQASLAQPHQVTMEARLGP